MLDTKTITRLGYLDIYVVGQSRVFSAAPKKKRRLVFLCKQGY